MRREGAKGFGGDLERLDGGWRWMDVGFGLKWLVGRTCAWLDAETMEMQSIWMGIGGSFLVSSSASVGHEVGGFLFFVFFWLFPAIDV